MDYPENDIMSSYEQLISMIKNFRGPEAYILDTIEKVSALPVKINTNVKLEDTKDVVNLLSDIRLNRI